MVGKRRLKGIAERRSSTYVKVQSSTLVLDHVRVIDGAGSIVWLGWKTDPFLLLSRASFLAAFLHDFAQKGLNNLKSK